MIPSHRVGVALGLTLITRHTRHLSPQQGVSSLVLYVVSTAVQTLARVIPSSVITLLTMCLSSRPPVYPGSSAPSPSYTHRMHTPHSPPHILDRTTVSPASPQYCNKPATIEIINKPTKLATYYKKEENSSR